MKVNVPMIVLTHEGGKAVTTNSYEALRRTTLACMLFEDNFYEDGKTAADRIHELCQQCTCEQILTVAVDCADKYHLRHMPLQMIVEALKKDKKPSNFSEVIDYIITRPDMMTDLLALYWKGGRQPLANQLKKGLAKAFLRFDEYQLSKYNRAAPIKLRDVLFLCHAKPIDPDQDALWKRLISNELKTADTWETRLSAGEDKKESFQELLDSHKMGKLAILRNMRNMQEAGISKTDVSRELLRNMKEMLPFQYLAAARECPAWEDIIDEAMIQSAALKPKLPGKTLVLVDVSGSMDAAISDKSKMLRIDAACGMAILLRETCEECQIYSFSNGIAAVPPRHGMALRDAIVTSQPHAGTMLGLTLEHIKHNATNYDRLIVITDEQASDDVPQMPKKKKHYILNIAGYQNGIGNKKQWTTITGFSEASIDFIREYEQIGVD